MKVICELFLLLCLAKVLPGMAQDIAYKNYHEQNGLPSSEVYSVFQDSNGLIWFTTDNGIVRFDGEELKVFNRSDGLSDPVIFSVFEDAHNNLWFRSFSGAAFIYREGRIKPYAFNARLKALVNKSPNSSLAIDSAGRMYVGVIGRGLFTIDTEGSVDTMEVTRSSLCLRSVTTNAFIAGSDSSFYDPKIFFTIDNKRYPVSFSSAKGVFICFRYCGNVLYVSTGRHLFRCDRDNLKLLYTSSAPIISLSADRDNMLWVGFQNHGVKRFVNDLPDASWHMPLLRHRSVTGVLQDNEGGFWFSTLDRGVYYVPNLAVQNFSLPAESKINAVLEGAESIFIAYNHGILSCLDKKTNKEKWSVNVHEPIMSGLWEGKQDRVWISGPSKSLILDAQGKIVREHAYAFGARNFVGINKLVRNRNAVWGVNVYGVYKLNLKGDLLYKKKLDLWCRNILIDGGVAYLAGVTGLYRSDTSLTAIEKIDAFDNDKISGITRLPGDRILVTTIGNGFKIMQGEKVTAYGKEQGLVFENIYSVAVDSALWLGTEKGLLKVDLKSLLTREVVDYEMLNRNTGLLSSKVNFMARDNKVTWCFFNDGYSVVDMRAVHFANRHPIPRLKQTRINNTVTSPDRIGELSHQENTIGFTYGFLAFNNREIYLRHRLANTGKPWHYTQNLLIDYHALAPGNYAFSMEYSTDRLTWQTAGPPIAVHIRPAWWETTYFRLGVIVLLSLGFFVYFRARYKSRLLQLELENKLRSEKERIARDLHDNIGSKLVLLSLGFDQVVKQYAIESSVAEPILSNVSTTMSELRDTIWAIQKEGISIAEFCDKLRNHVWRLRQSAGTVHYELHTDIQHEHHMLTPTQAINLYRIVQEAIANSQRHSGGDRIAMRVWCSTDGHTFCISIEDNGKGFDVQNMDGESHRGLRNMHSRASEICASFQLATRPGEGTHIEMALPLF
jgi:signal transduction histidine kinase/ligand-binding sensor domain-containing protein